MEMNVAIFVILQAITELKKQTQTLLNMETCTVCTLEGFYLDAVVIIIYNIQHKKLHCRFCF